MRTLNDYIECVLEYDHGFVEEEFEVTGDEQYEDWG